MQRKVAYSGKKKKQQLRERRARKASEPYWLDDDYVAPRGPAPATSTQLNEHFVRAEHAPLETTSFGMEGPNPQQKRLVSSFEKLSTATIRQAQLDSMQPFVRLPKTSLEFGVRDCQPVIDFPKRPEWSYDLTKEQLDDQEQKAFKQWKERVYETYGNRDDGRQLSWFEQNIEVWRQLWRVLEISDVLLIVMDIRNPLLHFPESLYHYITKDLKRKIIGVFNKVDLVSEFTVFAWTTYFNEQFPELHITTFSCFERDAKLIDDTKTYALKTKVKRPRSRYYSAQGVRDILKCCKAIASDKEGLHVDWDTLIQKYQHLDHDDASSSSDNDDDSDTGSMIGLEDEFSRVMELTAAEVKPHKDYVTLGLVGHPNVGKSSLINTIMQRTVVSTSRTPGHTKHFQTIYLSDNVRLCDSPGLVFPSLLPRALQVLSGMYPIAQVQEPYTIVQYLCEHIPLEDILSLVPPNVDVGPRFENWPADLPLPKDLDDSPRPWSAWMVCEAYAEQRGFFTAKAASPDAYRAANAILRLTCDGRILLSFKPPGFFTTTKYEQKRVEEADRQRERRDEHASEDDHDASDDESDDDDDQPGTGLSVTQGGMFSVLADDDNN
ncbi:hypothetical protein BC940DRAFT_298669 [Gongronella butleri]|nr:hypothetical protein BC940DRAFT_298669 [Gongronella butleri]